MKALVFEGPGEARVRDVTVPEVGSDDVLIASRVVGICHSDFDVLNGEYILPVHFPVTPGHEWSGEVLEVGEGVSQFRPGDRVVGECATAPDHHFGLTSNGAAAEQFVAKAEWLHRLPEEFSWSRGPWLSPSAWRFMLVGWLHH